MSEHGEQVAFNTFLERFGKTIGVENFFSIPNAAKRSYATARYFKKEGMKKGVPDFFIAHPKGPYGGLFIEFKFGRGRQTPEQIEWQRRLAYEYGYALVHSCAEAIEDTKKYMKGEV